MKFDMRSLNMSSSHRNPYCQYTRQKKKKKKDNKTRLITEQKKDRRQEARLAKDRLLLNDY